jgi:hypothetical protein
VHQVDLRSLPLEPGEAVPQRRRRLDPLEAEQDEELDGAGNVGGDNLDPDVLEHQNSKETRAATTPLVSQRICEADIHPQRIVSYGSWPW